MKVTDEMVDRFLAWRLPEDFHPDAGISFSPYFNVEYNAKHGKPPQRHQPIGTNLFTATQARQMLQHILAAAPEARTPIDWPEVHRLMVEYGNSQFDCGEHGGDDEKPEPYAKVHARATAAREALEAYLRRAMNSGEHNG